MRTMTIAVLAVSLATTPVLAQSGHDLFQQALVKERAAGAYLVPSFGRYDIVAELVAGVR